jgi:hypothetical protein
LWPDLPFSPGHSPLLLEAENQRHPPLGVACKYGYKLRWYIIVNELNHSIEQRAVAEGVQRLVTAITVYPLVNDYSVANTTPARSLS